MMRNPGRVALTVLTSLAVGLAAAPAGAVVGPCPAPNGQVAVGVMAPPPLPVEHQPPMPAYGYAWTPGYWAWNGGVNDYYWTPGVWVLPPAIGLLWTPGYWGWNDGVYIFNGGYWGPHVGFYGGINYGFGYGGFGYNGGYWQGRTFYYNRAATNFGGLRVNAVYNASVSVNRGAGRTSFNGGPRGVHAAPTGAEAAAARDPHVAATAMQQAHAQNAATTPGLRAGVNHGHPLLAAAAGVAAGVGAHAAFQHAAAQHSEARRAEAQHPGARAAAMRGEAHETARREAAGGQGPSRAAAAPHEAQREFGGGGHSMRAAPAREAAPREAAPRQAERGPSGGGHPAQEHHGGGERPRR
jgi:hypothetical protein